MPSETPVWSDTYKTFGDAMGLHFRTVIRMERDGEVRSVRFGNNPKKPIVRLEPPAEFLARQGRFSQPVEPPQDQPEA